MQKYQRLYEYIHEYQRLVYDYYSKHSLAFLVTYYNINKDTTIWDDTHMLGGYYEKLGELTGVRFNKYLLLPVYFVDEINTSFDGGEIGLIKENTTSIVIPSSYGITPYANDVVKFEQSYLRPENDTYPIFQVTGAEISANTDKRFWKLRIETSQSQTLDLVETQTEDTYVFFDYDKKIHTLEDASILTHLLQNNETLKNSLRSKWDSNSGFYFV